MSGFREKLYSEKTAQEIDKEVRRIIDDANQYALKIIRENKEMVELMTKMLIEFETLDSDDVQKIFKGEWNVEEKRAKLTRLEGAHKNPVEKSTPPPPPVLDSQKPNMGAGIDDQKPLEQPT